MDEIIAHARELGKKIAASPRSKSFFEAAKAVSDDREAQAVLNAFQEQVEHIRSLEAAGKPIEVADKRKLADAEAKVASNDKLKAMMRQQADYLEMMHAINQAIDEASQGAVGGGQ